jgi:shikimate dehydrogenase
VTAAVTRRAAVLGSPVGHSLSPVLHRAAYDHLGLTGWSYDAHEVDVHGLAGFLADLDRSWAGLSLTMPLKAAVLPLLDAASPVVETVGAANTVLLRDGLRVGENTDVPGMVGALAARGVTSVERAVVLGGGATARSAVAALAAVTRSVRVYVRDPARRAGLAAAAAGAGVTVELEPWARAADGLDAPLVVAATAAGATDPLVPAVPRAVGVLFDVLYDPWPTPLAAAWGARGGAVVDGLDLLVHQAVLQVSLMTGVEAEPADLARVLRAAGERALRA